MNIRKASPTRGLTLLELMVTLAIIALLAALLLPAMSLAKVRSQRTVCALKLKSLGTACREFSSDNAETLVNNLPLLAFGSPNPECWFQGSANLKHDPLYGSAPEFTSTNLALARSSKLFPYLRSYSAFVCPTDNRTLDGLRVVRSYSMNCWANGQSMGDPSGLVATAYDRSNDDRLKFRVFRRTDDISSPSDRWIMIEEDFDTIGDSMFAVVADQTKDQARAEKPSRRHLNAAPLLFADGHVGFFRLTDLARLREKDPVIVEQYVNKDLERLGNLAVEER